MVSSVVAGLADNESDAAPEPLPLSEQPEWQDVSPVPQEDGPDPLVPIMYSDECR
jgi:protein farnesyltransferase/geranylgeranyltransferase type-1 subunit alpha